LLFMKEMVGFKMLLSEISKGFGVYSAMRYQ